jgi:uncharacterized cupin superfamily protein
MPTPYAETIIHEGQVAAVVLSAEKIREFAATPEKYYFFTPGDFAFQAGVQHRPEGDMVEAHYHRPLSNIGTLPVQEFLHILSGEAVVTLYGELRVDGKPEVITNITLRAGDSIIMNTGHSIVFTKDCQCLNLKQGPYRGRDEEKIFVDV